MAIITYRDALNQAMDEEMAKDATVYILGEEVAEYNGAYKVTKGLLDKYGENRVIDTPITELGFTGIAVGSALAGLRPIVEWMTHNFAILALDQVINHAIKYYYMTNGQVTCPIVMRGPNGPAEYLSVQHSHALASIYAHFPGCKVIAPATPYDAKGLLKSAIRDNNPVIVLESEMIYGLKGEVPTEEYTVEIGKAAIKKTGTDVSLITFGKPLHITISAAEELAKIGIKAEVIDLRSVRPIDEDTLYESVRKTNRAVIIDESHPVASIGSHVGWLISKNCFDYLDAQVELVSSDDVPLPYNHSLELAAQPSIEKIIRTVKKIM